MPVIRITALIALLAWRMARVWVGLLGLAQLLGLPWASALMALLLLSNAMLPVRLCAVFGAVWVWHWPGMVAVIFAAPRLVLILPGLISTWLALVRHPRPVWHATQPAERAATAVR